MVLQIINTEEVIRRRGLGEAAQVSYCLDRYAKNMLLIQCKRKYQLKTEMVLNNSGVFRVFDTPFCLHWTVWWYM